MTNLGFIEKYIDKPSIVGSAKFQYLFWDVYFATLSASDGKYDAHKPFALSLKYLRDFKGTAIAERSASEIKKQGYGDDKKLKKWQQAMANLFPNVKEGQTITGLSNNDSHTIFYLDDKKLGVIDDKEFTPLFFNIWLSEKTSEPRFRKMLLKL